MSEIKLAVSDAEIRRCAAVMQQLRPSIGEDEFLLRAMGMPIVSFHFMKKL